LGKQINKMDCPKCNSNLHHKAGVIKGKQRYRCKECHYFYTVGKKSTGQDKGIKRLALEMYLEGIGFNSIARIFGVSHVSVQQWVKKNERILIGLKTDCPVNIIELDELYVYLSAKEKENHRGFLVIELCPGTTKSFWVLGEQKQVRVYGKKNRIFNRLDAAQLQD